MVMLKYLRMLLFPVAMLALNTTSHAQIAQGQPNVSIENELTKIPDARSEARRTLPEFLKRYHNRGPNDGMFAVQFPLDGWKHVWVDVKSISETTVTGTLRHERAIEDHEEGDTVSFDLDEISDWIYHDGQKLHGAFTSRVMLDRQDPETARTIREIFGWTE
ncbi:MAG: DUF2314 domain-containing protein [Blastomonas sp.]